MTSGHQVVSGTFSEDVVSIIEGLAKGRWKEQQVEGVGGSSQ